MSEEAQKQKPVQQFRAGALGVSIWQRRVKDDVFYNATPSRAYKDDKTEKWCYSESFNRDDLPVLGALLNRAFEWIIAQEAAAKDKAP